MMFKINLITIVLFLVFIWIDSKSQSTKDLFPKNHLEIQEPISYKTLSQFVKQVEKNNVIKVSVAGKTVEDRSIYLFHLSKKQETNPWKVFFFAQQHGNEPAGKDALIYLIDQINNDPDILPEDVDLWVIPMLNPDGAENNQRRNGNNFDLNRDHLLLSQPETQVLHETFRKIMPHVAIDCHEFMRDSRDYDEQGYAEWPLIMMDYANNPIFSQQILDLGKNWCEKVSEPMLQKGHNYIRYYLGGFPPNDELRHSTPEIDDARNALGAYGGLSFIIESGVKRKSENPNADLGERVDAYLDLFKQFLKPSSNRQKEIDAIEKSRSAEMIEFIPTNYFWGNIGQKITEVKVINKSDRKIKKIRTANFMHDLVVKNSVTSPKGYIVSKEHAELYKKLLEKHAIPYKVLTENNMYKIEQCTLDKIEDFRDPIYNRYAGRQIVNSDSIYNKTFQKGSILVECFGLNGRRAALLLEPKKLYGLYQYDEFANLISEDKVVPVWRVLN